MHANLSLITTVRQRFYLHRPHCSSSISNLSYGGHSGSFFQRMYNVWLALSPLLLAIAPCLAQQSSGARILIYSATRDYRHDSIPTAIQALKANQSSINVIFENTEDQTQFTDEVLSGYDALLFLDNTGEGKNTKCKHSQVLK